MLDLIPRTPLIRLAHRIVDGDPTERVLPTDEFTDHLLTTDPPAGMLEHHLPRTTVPSCGIEPQLLHDPRHLGLSDTKHPRDRALRDTFVRRLAHCTQQFQLQQFLLRRDSAQVTFDAVIDGYRSLPSPAVITNCITAGVLHRSVDHAPPHPHWSHGPCLRRMVRAHFSAIESNKEARTARHWPSSTTPRGTSPAAPPAPASQLESNCDADSLAARPRVPTSETAACPALSFVDMRPVATSPHCEVELVTQPKYSDAQHHCCDGAAQTETSRSSVSHSSPAPPAHTGRVT